MQAAPQPFSGWRTKGTSSQIPVGAAAPRHASPNNAAASFKKRRRTWLSLKDQNYDQGRGYCNDNVGEVLVRKRSGRKIVLNLAGLRSQASQLLIAERGYRLLDLLQIEAALFERLPGWLRREEPIYCGDVLLPDGGSVREGLAKLACRHDVILSRSRRSQERKGKNESA